MANNIGKAAKQVTKPADEYLKFVQQHFNVKDFSITKALHDIDMMSKNYSLDRTLADTDRIRMALKDFDKFNKYGDLGFSGIGLNDVYQLVQEIREDAKVYHNWLVKYKRYLKAAKKVHTGTKEDLHEELVVLGKAIIARATELTPIDTGFLRSSAFLYDFVDYVIMGFAAPYATYVHENMSISHPMHGDRNCYGQAKFLEKALQEFFPDTSVWVEHTGEGVVQAKIAINPLYVEYRHYGGS